MSKKPFAGYLAGYVEHLLDEPKPERQSNTFIDVQSEAQLEPIGRSLSVLFAEANAQLESKSESSDTPFFEPIISDDLFVEEDQSVILRLPMDERLTDSTFQTLIFEISGVKMAVPLVELGGIHPYVPLQHIIGKPDWYAGFVQLKGRSVNCIDGAKWLFPDKTAHLKANGAVNLDLDLKDPINVELNENEYQFIIMLNDTNWGITCHHLVDTVLLFKEDVKWRDTDIKRPWMAGLVKEQMCAMLDTYQLTDMLDAGLTSDQR